MSDTITIDRNEPCEHCGSAGTSNLYVFPPQQPAVLCDRCYHDRIAVRTARRERELLADWGTIGQQRRAS